MNAKTTFLIIIGLFCPIYSFAQRTYDIPFRATLPTIDGLVDEDSLQGLPVFEQFTTTLPTTGKTPQSPTKVWMFHTPEGIYVAAICTSTNLRNEGSVRDQTGTGDYLTIGFDTWNDDQNAFEFTTNAFGQRVEQRTTSTFSELNFNTHWQVNTARRADGWTAEFFIPFTALRFSKQNTNWGVQITRRDPSTGETSNWNPTDPLVRDRVLQYGILENLVIGRTKQRLGLGVLAQTSSLDASTRYDLTTYCAIDGKVGIGTASTVDFSILPEEVLFDYDVYDFSFTLKGTSQSDLRQLFTEEPGLFEKTDQSNKRTYINNSIFIPYFTNPATFIIKGANTINQVRFTTRHNNGISYRVGNSILSRPTEVSGARYPHQPFISNISVEKSLRNNSWVQISNRFYGLGTKEINQNYTSVATQLRDKTNRFQWSGLLNTKVQNNQAVADGRISVQKVNGIFQYGFTHSTREKLDPNFVDPSISRSEANTTGYLNWNNFSGKQKYWLNSTRYLRFNAKHHDFFQNRAVTYLTIGHRGLNKRFQEIDFSVSTSPFGEKKVLVFSDTRFESRQLYRPLNAHFSFSTDARRRATLHLATHLSNRPAYDGQFSIKVAGRWVAHQKLVFLLEQKLGYNHNNQLVNPLQDRLVEQRNEIRYSTIAHAQYTPSRVFTLNVKAENRGFSWRQRQMLEFKNGTFNNYPYEFINNPENTSQIELKTMADINFNAASLLRFGFFYTVTNFQNGRSEYGAFDLSLLWNLNRI